MKLIKWLINKLLFRRCKSYAHLSYARFAMGYCCKGPFFALSTTLDSRLACADWKRKEKGK